MSVSEATVKSLLISLTAPSVSIPARLYGDLIGKPYLIGGRGPTAYDCVGLTIEFQRRRGLALPAYLSDEAELHRQLAAGGALADCHKLATAAPGCVVLLRGFDGGRHLGCMVDGYRMLHVSRDCAVIVEVLARSLWRTRVLGFYRMEAAQ